jgi:hypothetical protein
MGKKIDLLVRGIGVGALVFGLGLSHYSSRQNETALGVADAGQTKFFVDGFFHVVTGKDGVLSTDEMSKAIYDIKKRHCRVREDHTLKVTYARNGFYLSAVSDSGCFDFQEFISREELETYFARAF